MDEHQNSISNAEVIIICKEYLGFFRDELVYSEKQIFTDTSGYFKCTFQKGYEINIAARHKGYSIKTIYINKTPKNANVTKNIILDIDTLQNHPAIFFRNTEKISIIRSDDNKIVNKIGIDVTTGKSVKDITEADVWLQDNDFLVAKPGGGIIPIIN